LGEDMLCAKLSTQRQPIVDTNNNLDRVIIEDTSDGWRGYRNCVENEPTWRTLNPLY
jgi:hypothetical protein